MRWDTKAKKREPLKEWHPWFAWRPVRTADGLRVWLEKVERRGGWFDRSTPIAERYALHHHWCWEYRVSTRSAHFELPQISVDAKMPPVKPPQGSKPKDGAVLGRWYPERLATHGVSFELRQEGLNPRLWRVSGDGEERVEVDPGIEQWLGACLVHHGQPPRSESTPPTPRPCTHQNSAPRAKAPLAFGKLTNISPVLVDPGKRTYQLNDGPISSVSLVADDEGEFSCIGDFPNLDLVELRSGWYATSLEGGLLRLGSDPVGALKVSFEANIDAPIFYG